MDIIQVSFLLTLNRFHRMLWCFLYWIWLSKCWLVNNFSEVAVLRAKMFVQINNKGTITTSIVIFQLSLFLSLNRYLPTNYCLIVAALSKFSTLFQYLHWWPGTNGTKYSRIDQVKFVVDRQPLKNLKGYGLLKQK